ncbi:MAG TPA: selenium-binding family protein [Edaphobacter sp.]|nr:selenium-binding family protein [Edaphobacter sp.]
MLWKADPTFYPSPKLAAQAPHEKLAYVAAFNPNGDGKPDALVVVDVDPESSTYGQITGRTNMPKAGDELHHFGWNACSSALCPYAAHPHLERRYLVVPGLRSSRIHILDTKDDPRQPKIVKVIEPEELARRTGYSRPHTIHCGPDGVYMSALGAPDGEGPGGIFALDHYTFEPLGRWEVDRGKQYLGYDFAWHLGYDTAVTSEWGTPRMVESGVIPEELLAGKYGHSLHFFDLRKRRCIQTIDFGAEYQMVLELRPAHDPTKAYGFAGVVVSLKDLSSSIWLWFKDGDEWDAKKVIEIPAEPAAADLLPPILKGFGAVPPLLTDLNLSVDDQRLYASCWATGEMRQYDVSDPHNPKLIGSIHLGGIVRKATHPAHSGEALNGGPQMVELSRDGKRVYFTNSLYAAWDKQFYPERLDGWMVKVDVNPDGMALDPRFFLEFGDLRGHQVHLEGGDASSDSYCYP